MRSVLISAAMFIATGCANVPMGDPARSAEIKKFALKNGTAQIYVCRTSGLTGRGIRPDVELDGKQLAIVPRGTYIYQEVQPGTHSLVSKTLEHDSKITFTIAAGEQKFFETWISMGFLTGWAIIDEIDDAAGRNCVANNELLETAER